MFRDIIAQLRIQKLNPGKFAAFVCWSQVINQVSRDICFNIMMSFVLLECMMNAPKFDDVYETIKKNLIAFETFVNNLCCVTFAAKVQGHCVHVFL